MMQEKCCDREARLKLIELGESGLAHLRWYLEKFGDSPSQVVLRAGVGGGRVVMAAPDQVEGGELEELRGGRGWGVEAGEAAEAYMRWAVGAALGDGKTRVVWFEYGRDLTRGAPKTAHFRFRPSTMATWDGSEWRAWEMGGCLFLVGSDGADERFDRFMDEVYWSTRIGFVSELSEEDAAGLADGCDVEMGELERLVRGCVMIVVPAVDGETYVIWTGESAGFAD